MKRLRGCIWLTAGLVVALVAGIVGFVTLNGAAERRSGEEGAVPEIEVVIAAKDLQVRSILTEADLEVALMPVDLVPQTAVRELDAAVGKIVLADIYAGEVILAGRLVDPNVLTANGRYALLVAENEVLVALPTADLMTRIDILKPGDHVDLLFSLEFPMGDKVDQAEVGEEAQVTFNLLQNLTIAAIVGGQTQTGGQGAATTPQAILLTVTPQDALALKYVVDAGAILGVVVRPPGVERPYDTLPVDIEYLIDRYGIPTGPEQ